MNFNQEDFSIRAMKYCSESARVRCESAIDNGNMDSISIINCVHKEFVAMFCNAIGRRKNSVNVLTPEQKKLLQKVENEVWPGIFSSIDNILLEIRAKKRKT